MTRATAVSLLALLLGTPEPAFVQSTLRDGTIIEQASCPAFPALTYPEYVTSMTRVFADEALAAKREGIVMASPLPLTSQQVFEREIARSKGIECTQMVYLSDGLKVKGFIWRPIGSGSKRLPLIIFNRGGNREFGKNGPWQVFHRLAADGFVVIASQYRGVDGGEGKEEFGGADVNDVANLVPLGQSLGYVDTSNIFMLGWSRGAMMTLLAVKRGMPLNAVAVGGGLLDLVAESKRRPALPTNVLSQLMIGFESRREELLRERSALYWPEKIEVPTLILHGTADWRASPSEALLFAQKLQEAGKTYELIMYAGDDHSLTGNRVDVNRRIVDWFKRHSK